MSLSIKVTKTEGSEEDREATHFIYLAPDSFTNKYMSESKVFKSLVDLAKENENGILTPKQYSAFIPEFAKEKIALESTGAHIARHGVPEGITVYEFIKGCYKGLMQAEKENR